MTTSRITSRDLLYRTRLGVPWVMLLLVATCALVAVPLVVDPRRYYLILGVSFCDEDGPVRWWHAVVARFVHGAGCGFPPIWFHLGVNVSLFLFQGALVERLLGSGRVALLTFTCLAVQIPLAHLLAGGRVHGASGMAWSYLLFALDALVWLWRRSRWSLLRDGTTGALALISLVAIAGLAKHWHLWSLAASAPFYLAWRKTFRANLEAVASGGDADRGSAPGNRAGSLVAAAIAAFNAFFVASAVLRSG
jgi:membrane associated rhomboid family serine protease